MSDAPRTDLRAPETSLAETVDAAVRRIVTGIVIGSGIIALGLYSRPGPPRYQAFPTPTGIVRVDMRSGTVLSCEGTRCYTIVKHGQHLERGPPPAAVPAAPRPPSPPLPRPQG